MSTTFGLHRAVQFYPDATATLFEDRTRNWREVAERVARLAAALRGHGVAEGERAAILMLNQDRYFELYLALAWAGAVAVPLNIRWSAAENLDCLRDCRPKLLVVDSVFAQMGGGLAAAAGLPLVFADDGATPEGALDYEALLAAAEPMADAEAHEESLAGVFYTGGTTGRSKGVMLSHRNLLANARNMLAYSSKQLRAEGNVILHAAPMFHLAAVSAMHSWLLRGDAHAIVRLFSPEAVARGIERFRANQTVLVPTMIQMLIDHPVAKECDLSALRLLFYGASPMPEALLDRAMAALPQVEFYQAYGMTELSPVATVLTWEDHLGEARAKGRHRSGGRAAPMVEVRVVGPDGRTLPRREIGEITARGDIVMMGYWERPEETAAALVDGWMRTGDAGYMDEDGFVYLVDRVKDMIVTGGENVYSVEVENCVASHPAVAMCAVIGIPDQRWGEAVHAIVMRKPGASVNEAEIVEHCRQRIANYKAPRSVKIQDEPLPLSGAGKVLKRELRKPYWEGMTRRIN
jgi:long-chain acyl-CoA synthetase